MKGSNILKTIYKKKYFNKVIDEKAVTVDLLDSLSARRTDMPNSPAKNTYVIILMMKNATLKQTGNY